MTCDHLDAPVYADNSPASAGRIRWCRECGALAVNDQWDEPALRSRLAAAEHEAHIATTTRIAAEKRALEAERERDEALAKLKIEEFEANLGLIDRASRLEAALRGTARVRDDGSPCWCQDFQPHHGEACLRARAALAEGDARG